MRPDAPVRGRPAPAPAVWASTECKAIEAAGLLAARFGLGVEAHPSLDEIDRQHDAPRAGCAWMADRETGAMRHGWRPLEQIALSFGRETP